KILASQLQQQFTEIMTIENTSMFELSKTSLAVYDLILSTVTLANLGGIYTVVTPIITYEDAKKIKKQLQWIERFTRIKETENAKQTEDNITKLKDLHDYTSVIQQILASCQVTDCGVFESIEIVWQTICAELEDWHFIDHAP